MVMISLFIVIGHFVWDHFYPSATIRYRITVNVETPEGIKSGSAVRELRVSRFPSPSPDARGFSAKLTGEAVVVDLGSKGKIFSLLDYPSAYITIAESFSRNLGRDDILFFRNLKPGTKVAVPLSGQHEIVYFSDLSDPKTVQAVYKTKRIDTKSIHKKGYEADDRLSEIFGPGYRVKDITIEITRDPITRGVAEIIPPFGRKVYSFSRDRYIGWD